jgi:hypothetical protein
MRIAALRQKIRSKNITETLCNKQLFTAKHALLLLKLCNLKAQV